MTTHPDREQLAGYLAGRLPDDEAGCLTAHLAGCPDCRGRLESLPDDDPLVGLLRSLAPDAGTAVGGHPRYEVLEEVRQGGMGVVYRARHRLLGRDAALKAIHPRLAGRPGASARFRREMEAVARLDHPNVVRVYEAEEHAGQLVLALEFVPGRDLGRLVGERGPLPVVEACGYVRQAALGLHHAHERGLLHRDVKPSNLMLAPGGQVKVLDFGLATLLDSDEPPEPADGEAETPDA